MNLRQLEDRIVPVLRAAYLRGARSRRELEVVARLELDALGLELRTVPIIDAYPCLGGVRIYAELWVQPRAGLISPARVFCIRTRRELEGCPTCSGSGCLWCRGTGWRRKEA